MLFRRHGGVRHGLPPPLDLKPFVIDFKTLSTNQLDGLKREGIITFFEYANERRRRIGLPPLKEML